MTNPFVAPIDSTAGTVFYRLLLINDWSALNIIVATHRDAGIMVFMSEILPHDQWGHFYTA
jgi:hypothetical protein